MNEILSDKQPEKIKLQPEVGNTGPAKYESLFEMMRAEPGALAKVVAEWVVIGLLISFGIAILFLIVLGCHTLVHIAP